MLTEHLILAQNSSIDQENNSLSVFGLLEDLNIQAPTPQVNVPMQAVVILKREDERGPVEEEFELQALDPDDRVLLSQVLPLKMDADHRRTRVRVNFQVLVEKSGDYTVRILSKKVKNIFKETRFGVTLIRSISHPKPQS